MLDKLLFYVYYITCVRVNLFSHFHFNTYARVAQWWSTSLPRRGSRVRSPSRALLDNKKDFPLWEVLFCYSRSAMHFSNPYCFAVQVRFLSALKRPSVVPKPRSTGPCGTRLAYSDISINFSLSECSFYYLRSALYFLNSYYFAVILYNYLLQTSIIYQLLSQLNIVTNVMHIYQ